MVMPYLICIIVGICVLWFAKLVGSGVLYSLSVNDALYLINIYYYFYLWNYEIAGLWSNLLANRA